MSAEEILSALVAVQEEYDSLRQNVVKTSSSNLKLEEELNSTILRTNNMKSKLSCLNHEEKKNLVSLSERELHCLSKIVEREQQRTVTEVAVRNVLKSISVNSAYKPSIPKVPVLIHEFENDFSVGLRRLRELKENIEHLRSLGSEKSDLLISLSNSHTDVLNQHIEVMGYPDEVSNAAKKAASEYESNMKCIAELSRNIEAEKPLLDDAERTYRGLLLEIESKMEIVTRIKAVLEK